LRNNAYDFGHLRIDQRNDAVAVALRRVEHLGAQLVNQALRDNGKRTKVVELAREEVLNRAFNLRDAIVELRPNIHVHIVSVLNNHRIRLRNGVHATTYFVDRLNDDGVITWESVTVWATLSLTILNVAVWN